ncbi:hypothetical protein [Virgibacillus sediminis]|uniref:Uncharacterized protein n=1 Tax=Virgibacillus sediminis TaxID=202260 RepID=A0ABV7A6Y5_9BACI
MLRFIRSSHGISPGTQFYRLLVSDISWCSDLSAAQAGYQPMREFISRSRGISADARIYRLLTQDISWGTDLLAAHATYQSEHSFIGSTLIYQQLRYLPCQFGYLELISVYQ